MKLLLLLSSLVAPVLATLLIPKEEYIKHNLFKNSEDGKQCDDCCDKGVVLTETVQFFGKKHSTFWPCANGLISFNAEVRDFTPEKFPVKGQPIIAAYWGDADLRTCRPDVNVRCSYWQVYYGDDSNFLNAKITGKYFKGEQTFVAKVAIVQTWDNVGYYDLQTDKRNTFQIVVVSDGFENAFAGIYYGKIDWTTGDSSDGVNGLEGIPAQMGFDAGDELNFYAHPLSQTDEVLNLENQEFLYAISNTKICDSGAELIDNVCTPLSCTVSDPFPIKDRNGNNAKKDDFTVNPEYAKPTHVTVGDCKKFLVKNTAGLYDKASHDDSCILQCQYKQDGDPSTYLTYQPRDLGTPENTEKGVTATCDASDWKDKAAINCVEVGIKYKVVGDATVLTVREASNSPTHAIEVSLKSKPYGIVIVDIQTSCKDGKRLLREGTTEIYYCEDDTNKPGTRTDPLAAIKTIGGKVYVTTVAFGPTATNAVQAWDAPRKFEIQGIDNTYKAANGYEKFKVLLSVRSTTGEDCNSKGCLVKNPYGQLKQEVGIDGKLVDDEGLELSPISLKTDESGKEASFSIDPIGSGGKTFVGHKITCKSSNELEGKITAYQVLGDSAKIPIPDDGIVTLTDKKVTFLVTGQPDNVVDGPQKFQIDCTKDPSEGTILGLEFINDDLNIPGVIIDTSLSKDFELASDIGSCLKSDPLREHKMPDGCGILKIKELSGSDTFTVKLVTKPLKGDVFVIVSVSDNTEVAVKPTSLKFNQENWNVAQTVEVVGVGDEGDLDGNILSSIDISVDTAVTTDIGFTKNQDDGPVLGYANCAATKTSKKDDKKTKTTEKPKTRRRLQNAEKTQKDLDLERAEIAINCFSYDSLKVTGDKTAVPDAGIITLDVETEDETYDATTVVTVAAGIIAAIVVIVIIVVIACAIAAYFFAMAIKKKRSEEAERKADIKKDADKAEDEIAFHMDEVDVENGLDNIEGVTAKLKGERDRLCEENVKLAASAGEEPMMCASTENPDVLVEQIKSLKGENDRLREGASRTKPGAQRKKKKKAAGFGQQQDE